MGKFDQSIIHPFANQDYSYEKRHILTSSKTNQDAIPQILYYRAIKKCGFCAFMFLPNFLHILLLEITIFFPPHCTLHRSVPGVQFSVELVTLRGRCHDQLIRGSSLISSWPHIRLLDGLSGAHFRQNLILFQRRRFHHF